MKKVLLVESGAVGGGSAESLYSHIKALNCEYSFIVLFLRKNRFSEKIESLGIKVFYFEQTLKNEQYARKHYIKNKMVNFLYKMQVSFFSKFLVLFEQLTHFTLIKYIQKIISDEDIDILHVNNQPNRDFYAILAGQSMNIEIISHIRTKNIYGFTKEKAEFCNKWVKKFVTYIDFKKTVWVNQGLLSEKISVVPNALEKKSVQNLKLLNEYQGKTIITLIGRIRPERGYEFFFKILKKLSKEREDIVLLIVGNYEGFESYYSSLVSLIEELKINRYVKFYGYTDKPHNIICESSLVVLPYNEVAFGRIVMESWQYKTPLVISKIQGIENYISDKNNALLCEYNNIDSWVEAILSLCNNKELYSKLQKNGYSTYELNYTIEVYKKNMNELYK